MSTSITLRRPNSRVGARVELGRYSASDGSERAIFGQRVDGVVRVVDCPLGAGRSYLVERELEQDGHAALNALVADYLQQARVHQQIPMLLPPGFLPSEPSNDESR